MISTMSFQKVSDVDITGKKVNQIQSLTQMLSCKFLNQFKDYQKEQLGRKFKIIFSIFQFRDLISGEGSKLKLAKCGIIKGPRTSDFGETQFCNFC